MNQAKRKPSVKVRKYVNIRPPESWEAIPLMGSGPSWAILQLNSRFTACRSTLSVLVTRWTPSRRCFPRPSSNVWCRSTVCPWQCMLAWKFWRQHFWQEVVFTPGILKVTIAEKRNILPKLTRMNHTTSSSDRTLDWRYIHSFVASSNRPYYCMWVWIRT